MSLKHLIYYNTFIYYKYNGNLLDINLFDGSNFNQFLTVHIDCIQLFVVIDNHNTRLKTTSCFDVEDEKILVIVKTLSSCGDAGKYLEEKNV